jgi:hypothetical protein
MTLAGLSTGVSSGQQLVNTTQSIVLGPPYQHMNVSTFASQSVVGCSKLSALDPPFFNHRTGFGGFALRAVAPLCYNSTGRYATGTLGFVLSIPIHPMRVNATALTKWTIRAQGGHLLSLGKCWHNNTNGPTIMCNQLSNASFFLASYILDTTNGNSYFSWKSSFFHEYSYSYKLATCPSSGSGNCHLQFGAQGPSNYSLNQTVALWSNGSGLNLSHRFLLVIAMVTDLVAGFEFTNGAVITGGRATAWLNMADTGNGAFLRSVTIT